MSIPSKRSEMIDRKNRFFGSGGASSVSFDRDGGIVGVVVDVVGDERIPSLSFRGDVINTVSSFSFSNSSGRSPFSPSPLIRGTIDLIASFSSDLLSSSFSVALGAGGWHSSFKDSCN